MHHTVKHSVSEYVNGQAHTNGIESFWAMLKRGYNGVYHKMSVKHLARYVNEFTGRHNVRKLDTIKQMESAVRGMEGKRLRYVDSLPNPVYYGTPIKDKRHERSIHTEAQTRPSGQVHHARADTRHGGEYRQGDFGYSAKETA